MNVRDESFDRITADPKVMGGRPCIRGMRVTVSNIVGQLAAGAPQAELLAEYPYLEGADIEMGLGIAASLAAPTIAAE